LSVGGLSGGVFFHRLIVCAALVAAMVLNAAPKVTLPPAKVRAALELDAFYQKHVDVGGFSIVSSKKVSDYALLEAAYLIRQMVGPRDDILQAMAKNKVRFGIMAHNELTTQIPEHSDLQPRLYWNKRARGLGATPERPVVTCGEENLLGYKDDPYSEENILVHELSHAIHEMALNDLDRTFDPRLEAAYDAAMKASLWKGKYAARNHMEYFAEGVQSWFDTNRENDFEHNHVNTRVELKQYDPRLAKLIKEIFGDGKWRYQRPANRKPASAHLKSYNAKKAPTFAWPARETAWYARFKQGKETLAPAGAVNVELLSSNSTNWRSPRTPQRSRIYIANASRRSVRLEWIDFDGNTKAYGVELRPTDHKTEYTYAGHVWRIVDDKTGRVLHYFVTPKAPGKVVIKD
jgi:hypothetical protein